MGISIHIRTLTVVSLIFLAGLSRAAENTEQPKLPYYDWGACPFECCTYQDWTAIKSIRVME